MRWPTAICLFLIAVAVSACTPANWVSPVSSSEVESVKVSVGFTHASLWEDKMVFGGISSVTEEWDTEKSLELSRAAVLELESIKRLIRLHSADFFLEKAGAGIFRDCNQVFRGSGEVDGIALMEISESLPGIRYIFFTRIISDHSRSWEEKVPEYDDGKLEEIYIYYHAEREVVAEGLIYDLQNRVVVWSGVVRSNLSRHHDSEQHVDKPFGEQVAESVMAGGMPDMPTDEEVVADIHGQFSKNLPEVRTCRSNNENWLECAKALQAMRVEWNKSSQTALSKAQTSVADNKATD